MKNKPSPLKFFGTLGAIGAGLAGAGVPGGPSMHGLAGMIGANPRKGGFIEMLRQAKERKRRRNILNEAAHKATDYVSHEQAGTAPAGFAALMGRQSNIDKDGNFVLHSGQRLWHNPGSNIAADMDFTNLNNKLAMQGPGWGFSGTGKYF
tara:strand:+ start:177 stop:626 length:450 start_codon:yes stop_codon:yes gene_type:complete